MRSTSVLFVSVSVDRFSSRCPLSAVHQGHKNRKWESRLTSR